MSGQLIFVFVSYYYDISWNHTPIKMRLQLIAPICCFLLAVTASTTLVVADETLSLPREHQDQPRDVQITSVEVAIYPSQAVQPAPQLDVDQERGVAERVLNWNWNQRRPTRRPTTRRPTRRRRRPTFEPTYFPTLNPTYTSNPSAKPTRNRKRPTKRPTRKPTRKPTSKPAVATCVRETNVCGPSKPCPFSGGRRMCCSQYGVSMSTFD